MEMRKCSKCGEEKPGTEYYRKNKWTCKKCVKKTNLDRRRKLAGMNLTSDQRVCRRCGEVRYLSQYWYGNGYVCKICRPEKPDRIKRYRDRGLDLEDAREVAAKHPPRAMTLRYPEGIRSIIKHYKCRHRVKGDLDRVEAAARGEGGGIDD